MRDLSSFSSSLKEFFTRDVRYDTRIFPYKSRLVPRPVVPPMDQEDVKEVLKLEEAQRKQQEADEVEVLDVEEIDNEGISKWEVERIIDRRVSRFGPRHKSAEQRGFDYKVVWKPEGAYPDSWEPAKNLEDSQELIKDFEDLHLGEDEKESSSKGPLRRSDRLNLFSLFQKDPTTRAEALASDQSEEWLVAEKDELQSIQERGVWTLVDKEPGMNVLGCRFVYKTKRKPDGTVEKFKVRLVA